MLGRALIVAVPCVLLASAPTLAQGYQIKVRFHNNSSQAADFNWHNNDAGGNVTKGSLDARTFSDPTASWEPGATETEEKYDLSFTVAGGKKCSATLHVTKGIDIAGISTGAPLACTIVGRINDGITCDSASDVGGGSDWTHPPYCTATLRLD